MILGFALMIAAHLMCHVYIFHFKTNTTSFYISSSSDSNAFLYKYEPVMQLTLVAHNYFSHTLDNTLIKIVMISIGKQ